MAQKYSGTLQKSILNEIKLQIDTPQAHLCEGPALEDPEEQRDDGGHPRAG